MEWVCVCTMCNDSNDCIPTEQARELVHKWRRVAEAGNSNGHNADVDRGLQTALEDCADELEDLL